MEAQNHLSLHQGYDWCTAWVATHACDVLILEGVRDGRMQFILPLEIVRRGPMRIARLLATNFSNINTGLYTEEFLSAAGAMRQVLEDARAELAGAFDLLLLEKVPLDWRGRASPFAGLPATLNQNAAFQLELLDVQLSGKNRMDARSFVNGVRTVER